VNTLHFIYKVKDKAALLGEGDINRLIEKMINHVTPMEIYRKLYWKCFGMIKIEEKMISVCIKCIVLKY
jgi:hypothetical protein